MRKTKSSIKQIIIPGMLFEDMGLTYLYPVDGHNIPQLIKTFQEAKRFEGPILVHVLTQKAAAMSRRCATRQDSTVRVDSM